MPDWKGRSIQWSAGRQWQEYDSTGIFPVASDCIRGALCQIQGQQGRPCIFRGNVLGSAIGSRHGCIKRGMGIGQPLGSGIAGFGQGPILHGLGHF